MLALPWGFEIYGLLTRWNPLNVRRPYALPYNGKNVLVVGLGPAGYTLAHYLLNEGFGVVGIDGLKIEPFADALTGQQRRAARAHPRLRASSASELDERVLAGFGGVSEYGITVRWDKNFLTLIHLTLARRENLRIYGGVRFGGTLTIEDAWELGLRPHRHRRRARASPTIIGMKNNLIRGIRKATDFLMALQLTGAFKKDSLANLQVRLPASSSAAASPAIDTATELLAYYPVQVEKTLERHETLSRELGEDAVLAKLRRRGAGATYRRSSSTAARSAPSASGARGAGERPDFIKLVRGWGGVSLVLPPQPHRLARLPAEPRRGGQGARGGHPLRRAHEPGGGLPDEHGAVQRAQVRADGDEGRQAQGQRRVLRAARETVCVAAGTSPNVTYEKEYPGTFQLDDERRVLPAASTRSSEDGDGFELAPCEADEDLGAKVGFFTCYQKDGPLHLASTATTTRPTRATW